MSRKLSEKELREEAEKLMNEDSKSEHYSSSENENEYILDEEKLQEEDEEILLDEVHYDGNYSSEDEDECMPPKKRFSDEKENSDFKWKINDSFNPKYFNFDRSSSGVTDLFTVSDGQQEVEYFLQFFNENILNIISTETNRYAGQNEKVRNTGWQDTDVGELYTFFGMNILMGIVEKNSLKDYWSTRKSIETPFFGSVFRRDRFLNLMYNLHFVNNEGDIRKDDPLRKLRNIVDIIKAKFRELFYPFQNICIDESLVLWKGRLSFKQFIPSKRNRFGIKLFEACDCETGYILNFIVYTGAKTDLMDEGNKFGISGSIVYSLLQKYIDKNHILFVDNWYSSPLLFKYLFDRNTGACGTVRANRKGMPEFRKKLGRGECETANTENMLAIKWLDKRYVHMLTTVYSGKMKSTGKINQKTKETILKPDCVMHYNENMGAVDKVDMQVSFVECARKSLKWYKKLFFHLIDISLYNAYILYQVKTGKKPQFSDFRLNVAEQLIEKYHTPKGHMKRPPTIDHPLRLTARHFPSLVPPTEAKGSKTQRRCHVCSQTKLQTRKRKATRFMCKECNVALCVTPCFATFHTRKYY